MSSTFATSDPRRAARFSNGARALARVLAVPGDDLEDARVLCREAAGHGDDALAHGLNRLADLLLLSDRESVARSYARLFLGPFDVLVPPYASWFLDPERKMMGPVALRAAETYASAGLQPADGPRELPDHAAVELEFCYLLGYRAIERGDEQAAELLATFWKEQVKPWLPAFADAIAEHSDHPVFDAAADTLRALVAHGPTAAPRPVTEGAGHES